MFANTYCNTLKNVSRSVTFWLLLCVVMIVSVQNVLSETYGYYDTTYNELIMDTDPRFVLNLETYTKHITNSFNAIILYAIPVFCVIATVLVINRDYGDKFFEIEKAAGIKPLAYVFGRLSALITVGWCVTVLANLLTLHLYVYTRSGVFGMECGEYLANSTAGLLRMTLMRGLPTVLFYVCFTYVLGAMFQNGIAAAVGGLGYVLSSYASKLLFSYKAADMGIDFYFDYFHPYQQKLLNYLYCFGTEWQSKNAKVSDALVCISILTGTALVCATISYLRIRKRTV